MPTSQHHQISDICDVIYWVRPARLLDVGVGFGKYGLLAREYLELWDGREEYDAWEHRIDGIEAYAAYLKPWQRALYDHLYVGDAKDVVPTLEVRYDLVLLIDVLEHFTREDGAALLEALRARADNLLIATPKDIGHQGEDAFHNTYEAHRGQWHRRDFSLYEERLVIPNPYSWLVLLGSAARSVRASRARRRRALLRHRYGGWARRFFPSGG